MDDASEHSGLPHTVGGRAPVLLGVGTVCQRLDAAPLPGLGPIELMQEALRRSLADAQVAGLAGRLDAVLVPRGTWKHADPGRAVAAAVGADAVRSVVSEVGVLQQSLIALACRLVATGEARAVAVVGGEAMHRARVAAAAGVGLSADVADGPWPGPDEVLAPGGEIVSAMEIERHFAVPVHQYALIESVLAHCDGHTPRERETHVARLWARGAEVAADLPDDSDVWDPTRWTAAELSSPARGNRLLASPYRRRCVSDWTVDQAAALVVASVDTARELGVDPGRWVSPVALGETNHIVALSARPDLGGCPAWRLIGHELAAACGVAAGDVDHLDLYSCFPSAVQVAAAELLGIDDLAGRPWTVTGGMTFGGGPFNNYVLQSTAAMARVLRSRPGETGLVTSVSGMLSKVAAAVWRGGAPQAELVDFDVSARAAALSPARRERPDLQGEARVVAATVVHDREGPVRALAVVESAAGERCAAVTEDGATIAVWSERDVVGELVTVDGRGALVSAS